jgi:glycosyltransferase involved in cell wall biosynthesis
MLSGDGARAAAPKRVVLVASELLGSSPCGGLGTATTMLAVALARMGHEVEVLAVDLQNEGLTDDWRATYARERVHVRRLARSDHPIDPESARLGLDVARALSVAPPDTVITQDWCGPANTAIRLKALGLGFGKTQFIVNCHGTHRWTKESGNNLGWDLAAFESELAERFSVAHCDAVVSPSAYMLEWMRSRQWQLPQVTEVIPNARGDPPTRHASRSDAVSRLVYFGRLEARKGLDLYLAALAHVPPILVEPVDLVFLGAETQQWDATRVRNTLRSSGISPRTLSVETSLDRGEAMRRLLVPGTLAVIPSLVDNSPYTIQECLELGVSFITAETGGGPELVAPEDRARVTFRPTARDLAARLTLALESAPRPAASSVDPASVLEAWRTLVDRLAPLDNRPPETGCATSITVVVVHDPRSGHDLQACLATLETACARAGPEVDTEITVVHTGESDPRNLRASLGHRASIVNVPGGSRWESRLAAAESSQRSWLVLLEDDDLVEADLLESLVTAQRHTSADAVTCAVRNSGTDSGTTRVFVGEPGSLGVLENRYGTVGLVRRELLAELGPLMVAGEPFDDPDWPLYASLSSRGASITTVPVPLVTRQRRGGHAEGVPDPSDALKVARIFEQAAGSPLGSLPVIAAVLFRAASERRAPPGDRHAMLPRALLRLTRNGSAGWARAVRRARLARGTNLSTRLSSRRRRRRSLP